MTDDVYDIDWSAEGDHLTAAAHNDAEWQAAAARRLVRSDDRLALDVGCGAAGMAIALAGALSAEGRVIALDGSAEVLATAGANVVAAGMSDRVELTQCDLHGGLDALRAVVDERADVVWASAVVHHVGDQQQAIVALASLLAPGGRLAVAEGGLSGRHLPWELGVGDPGLETRLAAAEDRWFAGMRATLPGSVPMPYGWTDALTRAGLAEVTTWSYLIEQVPPLAADDQASVIDGLRHRVGRIRETGLLAAADVAAWDRLLADDHGLAERTDVYRLGVRSVHVGRSVAS